MKKIKIGISSCVLGNNVRYDGNNKLNELILQPMLSEYEVISICPEMEMGLGAPRPPMNLYLNSKHEVEIWDVNLKHNFTDLFYQNINFEKYKDLSGLILQEKSPSCGLKNVKLYNKNQTLVENFSNNLGLFAKKIKALFPHIHMIQSNEIQCENDLKNFLDKCTFKI